MNFLRTVLFSVALTLIMARYFREDIPAGFSHPIMLQVFSMGLRICWDMGIFGNTLGLNGAVMQRKAMDISAILTPFVVTLKSTQTDMTIEGVRVRMYRPPKMQEGTLLPTVVYFHGGGWVAGSIETHEAITDRLAYDLNAVVFSVNYRQPPEHLFPAAFDDCVAVTKYILLNAKTYAGDPNRVAVMGDSAGGNLAAAVSIKLRDDKFKPMPALQALIYPALQAVNFNTPSRQFNKDAPVLKQRWSLELFNNYIFGNWDYLDIFYENNNTSPAFKKELFEKYMDLDILPYDKARKNYVPQALNQGNESFWEAHKSIFLNPYLSPLLAKNLEGLPRVYMSSCYHDPLRDDAYFYEKRLKDAKVTVQHVKLNLCVHAWMNAFGLVETFDNLFRDMVDSIQEQL